MLDSVSGLRDLVERGEYLAIECTGFARTETLHGTMPEEVGRVDGVLSFERSLQAGKANLSTTGRELLFALDVTTLHSGGIEPFQLTPAAIVVRTETTPDHTSVIERATPFPGRSSRIELDLINRLEDQLKGKVDQAGKALADGVGKAFDTCDIDRVIASQPEILKWLADEGLSASRTVRGPLFALLADIAVIEACWGIEGLPDEFGAVQDFYERALVAYGPEISTEHEARLITLRAKIDFMSGNQDTALELVENRSEPACVTLRLSILLQLERFSEAAAIRNIQPHEKWCDRAITARVMTGDRTGADEMLAWAKGRDDLTCYNRSLIAYSQALVIFALGGQDHALKARPHLITESQRSAAADALAALRPLLTPSDELNQLRSAVEIDAHSLAVRLAILTRDDDRRERSSKILSVARVVPLELGYATLRGDVPPRNDLPDVLRRDHPRSLDAQILAAMIEARRLDRADDAFLTLAEKTHLAKSPEQKLEIAQSLFELATATSVDMTDDSLQLAQGLLGRDHPFPRLVAAYRLVEAGDCAGADKILTEVGGPDDALWLQVSARRKSREGDEAGALEDIITVGILLGSVGPLWSAAGLAKSLNLEDREAFALNKLLEIKPDHINARKALAVSFLRGQEFARATAEFAKLRELGVNEKEVDFNHGLALCQSGQATKGLEVFGELAGRQPDWLPGVAAYAQLLQVMGRADDAFRRLHTTREKFWSLPSILMLYVQTCHAAACEVEAGEGLQRLLELRQAGDETASPLKMVSIEQFQEMMRQRFEGQKEVGRSILEGRFPWLLAGEFLNRPPTQDWSYRTQQHWNLGDHPLTRAEFTIYSTNGFRVEPADGQDSKQLVPTCCTPPDSPVVMDLTALITLHRIGILNEALDYFGKVLIPASYHTELLQDLAKLRPIQPFRLAGLRALRAAADRGRLMIRRPGEAVETQLATFYEYCGNDETTDYSAVDVASVLLAAGRITTDRFESLRAATTRPRTGHIMEGTTAVELGSLLSDEFTLAFLHQHAALDPLLDFARVYIDEGDLNRVRGELQSAEFDGEILDWHEKLRELLAADPRIESVPVLPREHLAVRVDGTAEGMPDTEVSDDETRSTRNRGTVALHAYEVARARAIPLLVDDRVFQTLASNDGPSRPQSVFGSGDLITALAHAGRLTPDRAAGLFLELTRLRYRFLLPPANLLVSLARRHRSFPPGDPLRDVARYVHDCMRDPGLHSGMEATDPPTSLAVHLHQQWALTVAEFIASIWHDEDFDDSAASTLTHWAIGECLPSIPPTCLPTQVAILGEVLPRIVISAALMHTAGHGDLARSSQALKQIAWSFSLSEIAYTRIVADILSPFIEREASDAAIPIGVIRVLATIACRHVREFDPLAEHVLCRLDVFETKHLEGQISSAQVAEIVNDAIQREHGFPPGPNALITFPDDPGPRSMVEVSLLVRCASKTVRSAALGFLRLLAVAHPVALSAHALSALERLSDAILADDHNRWYPAACNLAETLDEDYPLNLAALGQMIWNQTVSVAMPAWDKVLRPGRSLMTTILSQEHDPVASPESAASQIERIARSSNSLIKALEVYLERFGHLPLAPPFSAGSVVSRWLEGRGDEQAVWAEVWNWAKHQASPVRSHHACRIFLERPDLVPSGHHADFWEELATSLRASPVLTTAESHGRSWALRTDMARLYLLQCESNFPGHDPDKAARLAWWFACRSAGTIEEPGRGHTSPDGLLNFVHENIVSREHSNESTLARLGSGSTGLSLLGFATVYGGCPWALSLLSALGQGSEPLDPASASDDARAAISASLYQHLALGFPSNSEPSWPGTYGFEVTLGPSATYWADLEPNEEIKQFLKLMLKHHCQLASPGALIDRLQDLFSIDEGERLIFVNAFAAVAHCGDLPADRVLEVISDFRWFRRAMVELTDYEIIRLIDALIAAGRRFGGDWPAVVPQLIAAAVDLEGLSSDRQRFLVQNVLFACAAGRTTSAVRRLSQGIRPWRHKVLLDSLRQTIDDFVPHATPWVASHLRDLLSSLPAVTGLVMLPKPSPE